MERIRVFAIALVATAILFVNRSEAAQLSLAGDFEGKNKVGEFIYENNSYGLSISYYSPSLNNTTYFLVAKFDECSVMALYSVPRTRNIAIDGTCQGQGGRIYRKIYEWKDEYSSWCMVREITGERADLTMGIVASVESVARVINCSRIGASDTYEYESSALVDKKIDDEILRFRAAESGESTLMEYLDSLPSYSVSELISHINANNVQDINNLSFYLSENGRSYEAIPVLEAIVKRYPRRIVAKLNLADAYWLNNFSQKASCFYKEYCDDMISNGLKSKIPSRVGDRIIGCDN
ncbi:tetratricopeptide repeat protein [Cupriavidus pauculus]|uniref:tetratricopeptide repeat protein n=1 Tax=Cupriavidus pauculus TaxID=82633 RepID=UPI003857DB86